jgi:hypothetical protein
MAAWAPGGITVRFRVRNSIVWNLGIPLAITCCYTAAYYTAFFTVLYLDDYVSADWSDSLIILGGLTGGAIGSLGLVNSWCLLFPCLRNFTPRFALITWGSLLGGLLNLSSEDSFPSISFFVIWQGGMMLGLAIADAHWRHFNSAAYEKILALNPKLPRKAAPLPVSPKSTKDSELWKPAKRKQPVMNWVVTCLTALVAVAAITTKPWEALNTAETVPAAHLAVPEQKTPRIGVEKQEPRKSEQTGMKESIQKLSSDKLASARVTYFRRSFNFSPHNEEPTVGDETAERRQTQNKPVSSGAIGNRNKRGKAGIDARKTALAVLLADDPFVIQDTSWNGTLSPGNAKLIPQQLLKKHTYLFWFAISDPGVGSFLNLYDGEGRLMKTNTVRYPDRENGVGMIVTPETTGAYYLRLALAPGAKSDQEWAVIYAHKDRGL